MSASNDKKRLTAEEKRKALKDLAERMKLAPSTERYKNIRDFDSRHSDHDHVSPVTKGAGNVEAKILVMMQDWTSTEDMKTDEKYFSLPDHKLGYKSTSNTIVNLKARLYDHFRGMKLEDVFATNLFPFIKVGKPNASISSSDLLYAAEHYALPQIEIVRPILVIALGINPFWALAKKLGQPKPDEAKVQQLIDGPPLLGDGYEVWCQGHTAVDVPRGLANVNKSWARMANWFYGRLEPSLRN